MPHLIAEQRVDGGACRPPEQVGRTVGILREVFRRKPMGREERVLDERVRPSKAATALATHTAPLIKSFLVIFPPSAALESDAAPTGLAGPPSYARCFAFGVSLGFVIRGPTRSRRSIIRSAIAPQPTNAFPGKPMGRPLALGVSRILT